MVPVYKQKFRKPSREIPAELLDNFHHNSLNSQMVQQHPESVTAQRARQIGTINRQLAAEFHPAVKNVASAGQQLLRAYQNLSRHFYAYTASLYGLAYSSTNAEAPVQHQCKRLHQLAETMKKIHAEQIKWVEYFTAMTLTINRNSKTEKERLKTLVGAFADRERAFTKAVDKGRQMPVVLDRFYETELEAMRDQQVQRYRFFVDKHMVLLKRYREWIRFSGSLLDRELGLVDGVEEEEEDEQKHLDELVADVERRMGQSDQQCDGPSTENANRRIGEKRKENNGVESSRKQRQKPENTDAGSQSLPFPHRDSLPHSERVKTHVMEPEKQRGATKTQQASLVAELEAKFEADGKRQSLLRPIARRQRAPPIGQLQRHSVADAMVFSTRNSGNADQWPNHQSTAAGFLGQFYYNGPSSSKVANGTNGPIVIVTGGEEEEGEDKFKQFKLPRAQSKRQPSPMGLPAGIERPQLLSAQSLTSNNTNSHVPLYQQALMHHQHARQISQESVASSRSSGMPSMAARHTPSPAPTMFGPADYGRLVECTTAYSAGDENQLGMAVGERAQLVKSGRRGWVLTRSLQDGARQAWFPAKYLKLV